MMTESANKILQFEVVSAASLASTHISLYLLFVTYTCKVFGSSNLFVFKHKKDELSLKKKLQPWSNPSNHSSPKDWLPL